MIADRWFGVRLVFESLHPEEPGLDRFFEEQIILVAGADEEDARARATAHAITQEHQYKNVYGNTVEVVFREVLDVRDVLKEGEPGDFTEVYYHFLNAKELAQIRKSLEPGSADRRWPSEPADPATPAKPAHQRKRAQPPARNRA